MKNSELSILSVKFANAIRCEVTFNCFKHTTVQWVKTAIGKDRDWSDCRKAQSFEFTETHSVYIYVYLYIYNLEAFSEFSDFLFTLIKENFPTEVNFLNRSPDTFNFPEKFLNNSIFLVFYVK